MKSNVYDSSWKVIASLEKAKIHHLLLPEFCHPINLNGDMFSVTKFYLLLYPYDSPTSVVHKWKYSNSYNPFSLFFRKILSETVLGLLSSHFTVLL